MKEKLLQKRNQKGFTLMEMLIVVAIIAILVAIAIPVFNAQLDKARLATDNANERAAKAIAVATYLTDGADAVKGFFDAENGVLVAAAPSPGYGQHSTHAGQVITVSVNATTGAVDIDWGPAGATP